MGQLTERVNTCINAWNNISANCYEALNKMVATARANDVYYNDHEVRYQTGYDEIEGAAYAIVEKKAVDCKGQPIRVILNPAYRNTSNPGVNQKIFDASFLTSANMIITAVQAGSTTWGGPAMIAGAAMPGTVQENGYVYGFNKRGGLRYFPADVNETTLCQQGMVDVIGGCVPVVYDGKVLDEVTTMTDKESITAIGFNSGTGSVFFFSCSAQNEPGISIAGCARILTEYGCTIGVVTSHTVNTSEATSSEGMLYMGQMTTDPVQAIQPDNLAYWVISKRPCFKNEFEKEVADLVQTTGRNQWETYLLGVQIQSFDGRIRANTEAIKAEVERAMQSENWLQENINKEVNRAMQAEAWLQENINKEVDRATSSELEIKGMINEETSRAINAERDLRDRLNNEISERIQQDQIILQNIEQETIARSDEDRKLQDQINSIIAGNIDLPYLKLSGGNMTGNINMTNASTVVLGRGPVNPMEAATKKYVDDQVAGGITPGGDVSKEYVDNQIAAVTQEVDARVKKAGDTMSGALNMQGNKIISPILESSTGITLDNGSGEATRITNLANPLTNNDAVNLGYLNQAIDDATTAIEGSLDGRYLPLAGGTMTGNINMDKTSNITFYDDIAGSPAVGSIDNANDDITVISNNGAIDLVGTKINVASKTGSQIGIYGVNEVQLAEGTPDSTAIVLNTTSIVARSGILNVGEAGTITGSVGCGGVTLYNEDNTISASLSRHNGHLDININNDTGSLYINRSGATGGTGEIYLTEIHAPQELRLSPGTNVNVGTHRIRGVSDPVNNDDAVNLQTLIQQVYYYTKQIENNVYAVSLNDANSCILLNDRIILNDDTNPATNMFWYRGILFGSFTPAPFTKFVIKIPYALTINPYDVNVELVDIDDDSFTLHPDLNTYKYYGPGQIEFTGTVPSQIKNISHFYLNFKAQSIGGNDLPTNDLAVDSYYRGFGQYNAFRAKRK